ncbi:hypothetical protein [Streptomyces sp. NPDC001594]|uniref:hypothetical protein n=1 Tax=Streptomyces sp. NPDC001594 TaxID=3364590 RepID=UPI0036C0726F
MDVDEAAWELYGLRPEAFTAARDACAARARSAGEAAVAKQVAVWRRPTLGVWAANLLARSDQQQARRLLELGEGLREAHRTLAGPELRDLSHQRHVVITEMARQAGRLARDAGHPVSDTVQHEVEEILHAVLADPAAGPATDWARGVLRAAPPSPVGFTGLEPAAGATPRPAAAPPPRAEATRRAATTAPSRERERKRERELRTKAQAEAERTEREKDRAESEFTTAERDLEQARAAVAALDERIGALQDDLSRARHERAGLHEAEEAAARRRRQADTALKKAAAAAAEAARTWNALNG